MRAVATKVDGTAVITGDHDGDGDATKLTGRCIFDRDARISVIGTVCVGSDLGFGKSATCRSAETCKSDTRSHYLHELTAILTFEVLSAFLKFTIRERLEIIGMRQLFEAAPQISTLKTGRKRVPSLGLLICILCGLGVVHAVLQVTRHLNDDRSSSSRKG
jgi:hypothetical protein